MRIALIAVIALVFYCYSSTCSAQNDGFQSVSGDFAKNWLNNFLAKNPKSGMSSSGSGITSSGTESSSAVGLPSGTGNTSCQVDAIESLRIGFHMGQMYALANQGQNISGFNAEVDKYNAWVQKNFGDDVNSLMLKTITASGAPMTSPSYLETSPELMGVAFRRPFNASSELGKFGKQQVFTEIPPRSRSQEYAEAVAADAILRNF
jgi:hypothetical protein